MKKILAFTSIRSDYDLMSPLYKLLNQNPKIDFQLIVAGAHLSSNYGYSVQEIENDGLKILVKLETLLAYDSKSARVKSAGLLLQSAVDIVSNFSPDLILFTGDREDVIVSGMIASYLEIKSIHFYSGDHAEDGHVDNPARHAASKLATYHFVTLLEHKNRLVRIGEIPENIYIVGNLSLDNFVTHVPHDKIFLSDYFKIDLSQKYALVIFHPVSTESGSPEDYFENILLALQANNIIGVVSYPNIDPGNYAIINLIDKYSRNNNFVFYKNIPRNIFLSLYKKALFIIGNSSSGICESASIPIPAINVGIRQKSRTSSGNVRFCVGDFNAIDLAIKESINPNNLSKIKQIKNIYGDGSSAPKAYDLILEVLQKCYSPKTLDPLKIKLNYE